MNQLKTPPLFYSHSDQKIGRRLISKDPHSYAKPGMLILNLYLYSKFFFHNHCIIQGRRNWGGRGGRGPPNILGSRCNPESILCRGQAMVYIVQGRLRVGHPNILDLEPALHPARPYSILQVNFGNFASLHVYSILHNYSGD